ncbi:MAG: sigma-70 family RNA polymerase sigma factor [Oscillospiraceae bacterium]|nr:sigma-70 family RNA polymerase sigma factor [Oscillospiraceae bacterium]
MTVQVDEKTWFAAQVRELTPTLYRLSRSIVRNDADAQDAVAEAVTNAWEHLGDLREAEKFRPWLMRITANCSTQILRRRSRLAPLAEVSLLPAVPAPAAEDEYGLWAAVQRLPEDMRKVTVLFYYEQLSVAEISCIIGEKTGTVKTRLFRARQRLKEALS